MNNVDAVAHKQRLDILFAKFDDLPNDLEIRAHWARYLCVLMSGFIESSIRAILTAHVAVRSHPTVAKYVDSHLRRFQNPRVGDILELAGRFDPSWRTALEKALGDDNSELRNAINSVVDNRNKIAHGKDNSIGYTVVNRYYQNVVKVVELFEELCR